jgi:hypothetical protein
LARGQRPLVGSDRAGAAQPVHEPVPVLVPGQVDLGTGGDGEVLHGDGGMGRTRSSVAVDVSGDDPDQCPAVRRGEQGHVTGFEPLVSGFDHLVGGGKVHPQLEAVEEAAGGHQRFWWGFDVEDAAPGGHPLGGSVGDDTAAAMGVLVEEGAVDHVGDGLEAAMGVPRGALGFAGGVFDLAHLVHVDERVEVGVGDTGEGAVHREAFAFEALGGGGDRPDRSWNRGGRVWSAQAG